MIIPAVSSRREKNNVDSNPKRREIFGAKGEISANASNGIVVNNPARPFEIVKLSFIEEINGPTVVNGARRVDAIKIMPIRRIHVFFVKFIFLLV